MRLVTFSELRSLLELDNLNGELLMEAFRHLECGSHFIWTDINDIESKATAYAVEQGWNPDTTMVLYEPPATIPTYQEIPQMVGISKPIDDDFDILIGSLNPTQAVCSLYPNLTPEKLADTINRISRMRVFL